MNIKHQISNFINKTFRDEIIDIKPPREWWVEYKDVGKQLEGYIISVIYKYRGERKAYACIDNGFLGIISPDEALHHATVFYDNIRKKIALRRATQQNENIK